MECLLEVHKYWQQHRTQRIERKLVAGSGPQSCSDRGGPSEAYIGGDLAIFKFFDNRIFQEELRGINAVLTPSACSEREFMLALQYTNNRMMNWVACRHLPIEERYAGPQYFGHRLDKDRLQFVPLSFQVASKPIVRTRASAPGWLCCDLCEKWRRVDADSLQIWDNRSYFENQIEKASQLLSRMDSGMHRRLVKSVVQRHTEHRVFTLLDLQDIFDDVPDDEEFDASVSFNI